MTEKLLTGNQVAEILNISRSAAYQLLKNGKIHAVRIGRCVRCTPAEVDRFIAENTVGSESYTFRSHPIESKSEPPLKGVSYED